MVDRPPELVRRYLERSLPQDGARPRKVRIAQTGWMWQKPGARGLRFTATEEFAVERVAFTWRARFPVLGPIAIRVVDGYENGVGLLEARVLGVPIHRQGGRETLVGEALRYMAELPWAPYAMAWNRELDWRPLGDRRVEVAAKIGAERPAVTLDFSADGDVVRAWSPSRPRLVGKTVVSTPWAGEYSEYDVVGGIRIPTAAEVRWELPEGPFVYWRGRVTSLELAWHRRAGPVGHAARTISSSPRRPSPGSESSSRLTPLASKASRDSRCGLRRDEPGR